MKTQTGTDNPQLSVMDLGHTTIFLRDDGIVQLNCSDNFTYDVPQIIENTDVIKNIANNQKVLLLNIAAPHTLVSKEAREYLAVSNHREFIEADAYVIQSLAQSLLANFYVKINKPNTPTRFFQSTTLAENWLFTFRR